MKSYRIFFLLLILFVGIGIGLILSFNIGKPRPSAQNSSTTDSFPIVHISQALASELAATSFSGIARLSTPAVVTITSEKKQSSSDEETQFRFHRDMPEQGVGSGVIVSADGYIVTNNHVIDQAERIVVRLADRRSFEATLLGTDPLTDIALIRIDATGLPTITFGNSDMIQVGDWVIAVGSPLSLNSTVTAGIVSATNRQIEIIGDQYGVENFIQTDAVINPGNSGGALLNMRGELIGINTAIASRTGMYQGYGFAVPSNIVRNAVQDLSRYGRVVRGYIGVGIKDVDAIYAKAIGLDKARGVLVESLTEKGAARHSGVEEGDVILQIDDMPLFQRNELQAYVALHKPGESVRLQIWRDGRTVEKKVMLRNPDGNTDIPAEKIQRQNDAHIGSESWGYGLGFEVENLSDQGMRGVMISKSSWRAKAQNIYEGMILTRIQKTDINDVSVFEKTARELKNGEAVIIQLADRRNPANHILTAVEVHR